MMRLSPVEQVAGHAPFDEPEGASHASLVGESDAFKYLQFGIEQVGPAAAAVLLLGETGTGKTLVAQAIHRLSANRFGRFVSVNCASIPPTLLESELFGHERGAFTDARTTQAGRVELAHRGTLFLDEVGELPVEAQAKLLRFLQEGQFERLGSLRTVRVETRGTVSARFVLPAECLPHHRSTAASGESRDRTVRPTSSASSRARSAA